MKTEGIEKQSKMENEQLYEDLKKNRALLAEAQKNIQQAK